MTGSYLEPDESEKEMTGDLKPNYPQILWVQLDVHTSVPQEGASSAKIWSFFGGPSTSRGTLW